MRQDFNIAKFYDEAYEWVLNYGPRLIFGIIVLFIGWWLIKLLLNWSHQKMHNKRKSYWSTWKQLRFHNDLYLFH